MHHRLRTGDAVFAASHKSISISESIFVEGPFIEQRAYEQGVMCVFYQVPVPCVHWILEQTSRQQYGQNKRLTEQRQVDAESW
jgi:hypothetical protein